ncbi:MAG TPA: hypothetical protein VNT53_04325 [Pseudolysinimonas sp.]|nr:hypothetical protein [Pseudolysinimonas sp.]
MIVFILALIPAAAAAILLRTAPRLAFVIWLIVLFFVPVWVGASAGYFFSAITAVTLLCIAAGTLRGLRWTSIDSIVLLFAVLIAASFMLGGIEIGHLLTAFVSWMLPYAWGRMALAGLGRDFITSAIAAVTVIAAVLALIEFLTGVNIFGLMHWSNTAFDLWSPLQSRGGFVRAEGAFGHSIALGASLSIGSVFVLSARWHLAVRILSLATIGGAIVVTFSRIGIVTFVLGLLLAIAFLGKVLAPRIRVLIAGFAIAGALAAVPFLSEVFTDAGAEAQNSALYRIDLLSLVTQMSPVGLSSEYHVLPDGQVYIGNFQSIDSQLILLGLQLGFIPLVLLLIALVTSVVFLFTGRANTALVALVAQIPALATVALITQLPYLLWFVAGLGVSLYIEDRFAREVAAHQFGVTASKWRMETA